EPVLGRAGDMGQQLLLVARRRFDGLGVRRAELLDDGRDVLLAGSTVRGVHPVISPGSTRAAWRRLRRREGYSLTGVTRSPPDRAGRRDGSVSWPRVGG